MPATIIREIGNGYFGKVFLGNVNGEDVAVKVVEFSEVSEDETTITIIRSLDHPNIVKYKGGFNRGSSLEIYMELCDGGDLDGQMREYELRGRLIPEGTLSSWLRQTVSAIQYLHHHNILHRDIKPPNIMLNQGIIKLIDFGLAKMFESKQDFIDASVPLGTYSSPEIIMESYCDEKGDVWSTGATFYHLANFRPAFEDPENIRDYKNGIQRLEPVRQGYSLAFMNLIINMLDPDFTSRPATGTILDILEKEEKKDEEYREENENYEGNEERPIFALCCVDS